VYRGYKHVYRG